MLSLHSFVDVNIQTRLRPAVRAQLGQACEDSQHNARHCEKPCCFPII